MKMFHQRALQMAIIRLHRLRPAPPRRDCAFGQRSARIGNHQIRIADQLRAETMTGRAGAKMTVERKVFRRQLAKCEPGLRVSVIGRVAKFFPNCVRLDVGR